FVGEVLADEESMSALCAYYGISRTTGYKWLARYRALGPEGVKERARTPHRPGLARPAAKVLAGDEAEAALPAVGTEEAACEAAAGAPGLGGPGGEYDRRLAEAGQFGGRAPPTPMLSTL